VGEGHECWVWGAEAEEFSGGEWEVDGEGEGVWVVGV